MEFTAKQIAELIGGRIEGNENATVNTFAKIEEGVPGAISFLSNPKYTHHIYDTKSSVVLINEDVELDKPVAATLIRVKDAYESVAKLLQFYESMKPRKKGIHPTACIAESAKVGRDVFIGAYACIGEGAVIGDGAQLYPHVVIGDGVVIGCGEEAVNVKKPAVYAFGIATIAEQTVIPPNVRIGKNTAISGVTRLSDYPDGVLAGGQVIEAKEGEQV
jgi:UDP-3-O-[3-hydroxymyristoyl] glucosamine N-acyltransferase